MFFVYDNIVCRYFVTTINNLTVIYLQFGLFSSFI